MIITDDNDKVRRSPSPISTPNLSPTSSSSSRSSTTSLPPSTGHTQGRRSSYNSSRWSSAGQNDRASPTAYSNSGRRSSDTGSIHSQYNRRNSSPLGYVHLDDDLYDDPPPQYTRFDENHNPQRPHPQPQPHSTHYPYTSTNNSRRPQTRHTAPPQYPRPASNIGGDNGSIGGPPASVQPSNGIYIDRDNDNVAGSYIVDPDRSSLARKQENLNLASKNGVVDVDVAVLPVKGTSANADRATLKLDSKCGAVKLRLHDAPKRFLPNDGVGSFTPRTMTVDAESKNGVVHLCIPRSYQGILYLQTANGKIELSPGLRASMTTLDSNDQLGTTRVFGVMGHFDGLRDVQDALAAERVADAAEETRASYSVPNIPQFSGNGITTVTGPDGTTMYYSGGGRGMFNGVSNMSITGGEFHNVGGSEYVTVNGRPVRQYSGPHQSISNMSMTMRTQPQKRRQLSEILKSFHSDFKGSDITASSKNGAVKVWFDDETMDHQAGGWKANNEDVPSSPRRANTVFVNNGSGYARFSGTFTGMNIPFMNVGDSATFSNFSWFG